MVYLDGLREQQDAERGPRSTKDGRGFCTFVGECWRHPYVDDRHIGPVRERAAQQMLGIAGVRDDMEAMRFNTSIAKLIELTNHLTKTGQTSREVAEARAEFPSNLDV